MLGTNCNMINKGLKRLILRFKVQDEDQQSKAAVPLLSLYLSLKGNTGSTKPQTSASPQCEPLVSLTHLDSSQLPPSCQKSSPILSYLAIGHPALYETNLGDRSSHSINNYTATHETLVYPKHIQGMETCKYNVSTTNVKEIRQ